MMDDTVTPEPTQNDQQPLPQEESHRQVPVIFSGDAKEFFGIWIVNLLLTIVTLGIYSAWAKVRTQQYFYGNTKVDGHAFSYLAQPLQILKGRILAVILFAIYSLTLQFVPLVGIGIFIIMLFLIPWILNQSLRFNLRMSSYRNVRFSFKGNYGDAFVYWILLPIASVFTAYLMMPWALKKGDEYVYNNVSYGEKQLVTKIDTGQYYETVLWIFLVSIGLMFGVFAIALIVGVAGALLDLQGSGVSEMGLGVIVGIATGAFYVFSISILSAIYRARIRNHILNNSEFDGLATFKSNVEVTPFAILMFTNIVALLCSAGLAYPWMKLRHARFLAQATTVVINNDSDDVVDAMSESQSAFGEEAAEVFDMDISLT
jgi:uncharacterized membrane protein YjgN (DUF898 family)